MKKYDTAACRSCMLKYAPKGYPVIAINSNDPKVSPGDSYEKMKETAAKLNYKFDYLFDETQEVARKYGATNTPSHIYSLLEGWQTGGGLCQVPLTTTPMMLLRLIKNMPRMLSTAF
ncbi:MAG: redoxin domain-containing protein [Marinilabiliales bacterium]|nr:redoxin domain-containing protein [Marinilabiliales bacterium]